ncbi:DUF1643 domain-containing protein [Halorubellus sp. PRR65]|uniref:DUF1643 domain-containing protein n=1 Tax=Halorubellus sp. PRR65 TaxID=3098148 RepID=UPI002B259CA2|nr:DUF1643 domain-containing protein [Halorubellus sp. PRR65]
MTGDDPYIHRGDADEYTDMGAVLSNDENYRYQLWREWDPKKGTVGFVMVNPSTADGMEDDATITRIVNYAKRWGYGRVVVANLFALRSSDPSDLGEHEDPVGPKNDEYLQETCQEAEKVVAAWGTNGTRQNRHREVVETLDFELYALDTTKHGHPVHPLFEKKDLEPSPFDYDDDDEE